MKRSVIISDIPADDLPIQMACEQAGEYFDREIDREADREADRETDFFIRENNPESPSKLVSTITFQIIPDGSFVETNPFSQTNSGMTVFTTGVYSEKLRLWTS